MATLENLVNETTDIKNNVIECRDTLKQILIGKDVEVLESENKLSLLIDKIDGLDEIDTGKLWLYKYGQDCTDVTGGFTCKLTDVVTSNWSTQKVGDLTDTYIYHSSSSTRTFVSNVTSNKVDLTGYSKINFEFENIYYMDSRDYIQFTIKTDYSVNSSNVGVTWIYLSDVYKKGKKVLSIDISNLNTSYYISLHSGLYGNPCYNYIYNVWLEK